VIKLLFDDVNDIAPGLVQALQAITAVGAALLAVNSLQDEMVDAFIRLLEEERGHGFSRIFRASQAGNGFSSAAGQ